jgi:hypothetical protein
MAGRMYYYVLLPMKYIVNNRRWRIRFALLCTRNTIIFWLSIRPWIKFAVVCQSSLDHLCVCIVTKRNETWKTRNRIMNIHICFIWVWVTKMHWCECFLIYYIVFVISPLIFKLFKFLSVPWLFTFNRYPVCQTLQSNTRIVTIFSVRLPLFSYDLKTIFVFWSKFAIYFNKNKFGKIDICA